VSLLSSRIVLRQRNLGEIFDLVLPFITKHWRFWLRLSFATLIPLFSSIMALVFVLMGLVSTSYTEITDEAFWFLLLVPLAFLFAQDVFVVAASELLFTKDVTVRRVLRRYARHCVRGALAGLVLAVWNTVTLCFLVGVYYAPTRALVREAALLEGASLGVAFRRSAALTHDLVGHALGYWLVAWLIPFVTTAFVWLMGTSLCEYLLLIKASDQVHFLLAVLGIMVAVVPAAIARFFIYVDLRTRKEGWDLQLRLLALAAEAPESKQPGAAA
jgi:hypothetical protein